MIRAFVKEHRGDICCTAAGAAAGALAGNCVYKNTPAKMVRLVQDGANKREIITDKFVNYAKKVSIKDFYDHVDPHTDRNWLENKISIIKRQAAAAKANPKGFERKQFQKIYDLGVKFLTDRQSVPGEDAVLAKRGANAIVCGRKIEKRNCVVSCALIGGAALFAVKKLYDKYKSSKESGKSLEDLIPDNFKK